MRKNAARAMRRARRCSAVTTAKLPPPPRSAQNRSSSAAHLLVCPSAVTTSSARMRSSVSPSARPARPIPPPVAMPPIRPSGTSPTGSWRRVRRASRRRRCCGRRARSVAMPSSSAHGAQPAHVDHDGGPAGRGAVVGVPPRADGQRDVEAIGPAHDGLHVGAIAHLHDRRRAHSVVAAIEDQPTRRYSRRCRASAPGRAPLPGAPGPAPAAAGRPAPRARRCRAARGRPPSAARTRAVTWSWGDALTPPRRRGRRSAFPHAAIASSTERKLRPRSVSS